MTALAALLSAAAVWLWRPPGRWLVRQRFHRRTFGPLLPRRALVLAAPLVVIWGAGRADVSGPHVILAVTVAAVAMFGLRQWRGAARHRRLQERRRLVSEAIGLMSAELSECGASTWARPAMATFWNSMGGLACRETYLQ